MSIHLRERELRVHCAFTSLRTTHTESWTVAYSLSTPGSINEACARMRHDDAPTSQKKIMNGEEM